MLAMGASILAMPEKVQFNVYLPPELVREIKHRCIDTGISLSAYVQRALERYLTDPGDPIPRGHRENR